MSRISLRGLLIAWAMCMLLLTLAEAGLSLYGQRRVAELNELREKEDRIVRLSLRAGTAMLKARRYEKDLLLFREEFGFQETKSRYLPLVRTEIAEVQRRMAEIRALSEDPEIVRETKIVEQAVRSYESGFVQIVDLYRSLGFVDTGNEAEMRAKAHALESLLEPHRNDALLAGLLILRRHEKDYVRRRQDKHAEAFEAAARTFRVQVGRSALPADLKGSLHALTDDYLADFKEYVQTAAQIDQATAGYLKVLQVVEPSLGRLVLRASEMKAQADSQTRRLIQVTTAGSVIAGILAILIGGLLAFFVSRRITRPVRETMHFADRLAQGELDTRLNATRGAEFVA